MKIITNGDSWVYGSEIVNPLISGRYDKNVHPGEYEWIDENDSYRIPQIFPTYLGELFNADVINLAWPADDNKTILNRTITYICSNFIDKGYPTDDLLVIVGWSTPERNSFWYKDEKRSERFRLWPFLENFSTPHQKVFWEFYVTYLWNSEEYLTRYVMDIITFQNFCNNHKIKWLCFNSFYQMNRMDPSAWKDCNIESELGKLKLDFGHYFESPSTTKQIYNYEYNSVWKTVDPLRFYKKNSPNNTFRSFMVENNKINPYNGWHPSPESHKIWAEELYRYIDENKLI